MATAATPSSIKPVRLLSRLDLIVLVVLIFEMGKHAIEMFFDLDLSFPTSFPVLRDVYAIVIGVCALYAVVLTSRLWREDA